MWLIKLFFPAADWEKGVIVTYSPLIYCKYDLDHILIEHETTHIIQQGNHPLRWWIKYITNKDFRFDQEVEAHRNEYRAVKKRHGEFLNLIAERLSGPLYNNMVSKEEAKDLILLDM